MTSSFLIQVGATVTWTSESQGSAKTKTGIVRLRLPPGDDGYSRLMDFLEDKPEARKACQRFLCSSVPRYLVEVQRSHTITGDPLKPKWYAPLKSVVEKQNRL